MIKLIDAVIGPVLVSVVHMLLQPRKSATLRPASLLFIRPGGIGDAVLLIPAIQSLKKRFPDAAIHVLVEKRNTEVFSLCPEIDRMYHYDLPRELLAVMRNDYDVVIDTEQWHRLSAVVARMIQAPVTIGYATNERKKLFTHSIPYSHDAYEVLSFLDLTGALMGPASFDPDMTFLAVPQELSDRTAPLLKPLTGRKIITLFPGGSIVERKWGGDRFHRVAKLLSEEGYGVVVVGGGTDVGEGMEITRDVPNSLNLCGRLTVPETAAVLKESSLLVTGDSGIMHVGYGVGTKILALFGPGREKKWAPRGKNCIIINKNLPCSPCTKFGYTPTCKINAACMRNITVEEVFQASMKLIGGGPDNRNT